MAYSHDYFYNRIFNIHFFQWMVYGATGHLGQLVTQTVYIIVVEPAINHHLPTVVHIAVVMTLTLRTVQMECVEVRLSNISHF